jgi:hypothetical protein
MNELERYGVVPHGWFFEEQNQTIYLGTDVFPIPVPLNGAQVSHLLYEFERARKLAGRQWKDGMLLLPAHCQKEEKIVEEAEP